MSDQTTPTTAAPDKPPDRGKLAERLDALVDCTEDLDATLSAATGLLDRVPLPSDRRDRRAVNALVRLVAVAARQAEYLAGAAGEIAAECRGEPEPEASDPEPIAPDPIPEP